jgi:F-type H+-transporting ATPase subunit delta
MAVSRSSARRYAEAAFEIATADGTLDEWLRDLKLAADAVRQPTVQRLLGNPAVAVAVRLKAADDALGTRISDKAVNLIRLLIRRRRIELLPQVAARYEELYERQKGIVRATITSAAPLDDAELQAIQSRLSQMTGGTLRTDVNVDPSLLGGVIVRIGDRMIDGSVRGRLERLRNRIAAGTI